MVDEAVELLLPDNDREEAEDVVQEEMEEVGE